MTPIDRIAQALAAKGYVRAGYAGKPDAPTLERYVFIMWRSFIPDAEAAVAAMREPSEAMVSAAVTRGQASGYTDVVGQHHAMLDAMLEEGATPPANPAEAYIDRYMEKQSGRAPKPN